MNDLVRAVILGIIEGLTEFLPISSTGHMIIAMPWLGVDAHQIPWRPFLYFIQIGAIAAVVICFWRPLWRQVLSMPSGGWTNHLIVKLVVATIPAAAIGLPLHKWPSLYKALAAIRLNRYDIATPSSTQPIRIFGKIRRRR